MPQVTTGQRLGTRRDPRGSAHTSAASPSGGFISRTLSAFLGTAESLRVRGARGPQNSRDFKRLEVAASPSQLLGAAVPSPGRGDERLRRHETPSAVQHVSMLQCCIVLVAGTPVLGDGGPQRPGHGPSGTGLRCVGGRSLLCRRPLPNAGIAAPAPPRSARGQILMGAPVPGDTEVGDRGSVRTTDVR